MKNSAKSNNISKIIIYQEQPPGSELKAGGSIYAHSLPDMQGAQLAVIDADAQGRKYKNKAEALETADNKTESTPWEEYILQAHELLNPSGVLAFLSSAEESAAYKLLLDKIFRPENFVNQIIWHYALPGSAKKHFLKRHSVIYIYAKSKKYYINTLADGRERCHGGRVHLKKLTGPDGRSFYQASRGNKTLKYYADQQIPFDDVWDIPKINITSPESTGYPGQKPLALADRIILCFTRPGDSVIDFTCAGGSFALSACIHGRPFNGLACSRNDAHISFTRLLSAGCPRLEMHGGLSSTKEVVSLNMLERPKSLEIFLDGYGRSSAFSSQRPDGLDCVDFWAVGQIENNAFISGCFALKGGNADALNKCLKARKEKSCAVYIADIYGREKLIKLK